MANSKRTVQVVRSSITGQFVPKGRAITSPKTTQTETVRRTKK